MTGLGQKLKSSRRAYVFRFAAKNGHRVADERSPASFALTGLLKSRTVLG